MIKQLKAKQFLYHCCFANGNILHICKVVIHSTYFTVDRNCKAFELNEQNSILLVQLCIKLFNISNYSGPKSTPYKN